MSAVLPAPLDVSAAAPSPSLHRCRRGLCWLLLALVCALGGCQKTQTLGVEECMDCIPGGAGSSRDGASPGDSSFLFPDGVSVEEADEQTHQAAIDFRTAMVESGRIKAGTLGLVEP